MIEICDQPCATAYRRVRPALPARPQPQHRCEYHRYRRALILLLHRPPILARELTAVVPLAVGQETLPRHPLQPQDDGPRLLRRDAPDPAKRLPPPYALENSTVLVLQLVWTTHSLLPQLSFRPISHRFPGLQPIPCRPSHKNL